jgi:hypothetical protein
MLKAICDARSLRAADPDGRAMRIDLEQYLATPVQQPTARDPRARRAGVR